MLCWAQQPGGKEDPDVCSVVVSISSTKPRASPELLTCSPFPGGNPQSRPAETTWLVSALATQEGWLQAPVPPPGICVKSQLRPRFRFIWAMALISCVACHRSVPFSKLQVPFVLKGVSHPAQPDFRPHSMSQNPFLTPPRSWSRRAKVLK